MSNSTDESIEEVVLYWILERARFAPSGGHRSRAGGIVVTDPPGRERLPRRLSRPPVEDFVTRERFDGPVFGVGQNG